MTYEPTRRERIEWFYDWFRYYAMVFVALIVLVLLVSACVICLYGIITDYENKLNAPIDDEIVSIDGGIECHISTAGYRNEGALIDYISQNDGIITAMSHICDGHDETTTVQITWYRVIG